MFFGWALISQNPNIVSVCLNLVSSYLYDLFKGRTSDIRARLRVAIEPTEGATAKIVEYDGPVEGLKDVSKIIKSLHE